jgi:PHP family Zn ribbon phosphoesterase
MDGVFVSTFLLIGLMICMGISTVALHRLALKGKQYAEQIKQKSKETLELMGKTIRELDPGAPAGVTGKPPRPGLPDEFVCERCGMIMACKDTEDGQMKCPDCGEIWNISDFIGPP